MWRKIKGFENYEISKGGKVRKASTKKIVKTHINNKGYVRVNFYINNKIIKKLVHRLVAEAYIENPQGLNEINHINNKRDENTVKNLEWCTHSLNIKQSWITRHRQMKERARLCLQ